MTVKIYKGNDHNLRKQISEEFDAAAVATAAVAADVAAIMAAPVVTGSATAAFSAELVLTAGTNVEVTTGAGTITVAAGYTLPVHGLEIAAPVSGNTHYFGATLSEPSTTSATSRVYIPRAGTIKRAEIFCYSKIAGTAESWTVYIRKNDTADTTIASVAAAANVRRFASSAMNLSVSAGDYIEIKAVFPTWATPPENMLFSGVVMVE